MTFAPSDLSARQTTIMIAYGAALWFGAAMLLRVVGPLGAFQGVGVVILYALVIPGTVPFIWGARVVAKLSPDQTLLAITIATTTALLLDGLAVAWMPWLYGADATLVMGAAAAVLWGGGVGLALGFLMNGPRRT